jgi:hypothetical protein
VEVDLCLFFTETEVNESRDEFAVVCHINSS